MTSKRFCVIAPTFNAEKTIRQSMLSLAAQSYQNWKLIVVDDMSTDETRRVSLNLASNLGFYKYACEETNKFQLITNETKKWEIENTLIALKHCRDDDIIVRLDMDDYLINNTVFEQLAHIYDENPEVDAIWTNHMWFSEKDGLTNTNISGPMSSGTDPYKHPWVSSHMKTWRKHVSNGVSDANYRGEDGKYFTRIGDQAFYLPVLKLARNIGHFAITAYAYRCDQSKETFGTDDAKHQATEAQFLRKRGFLK